MTPPSARARTRIIPVATARTIVGTRTARMAAMGPGRTERRRRRRSAGGPDMASEKQIAANRRNARRSTGPRTPAGKVRAALNALTHGLTTQAADLSQDREGDQRLTR